MASTFRSLLQDTAVYGLSSMLGRFLNWMLTFVYVRVLLEQEMGQMTHLYAWTAVLLILLTYGMETTFFRFASKHDEPERVLGSTLWTLGISSSAFVLLGILTSGTVAPLLGQPDAPELVMMLVGIVALDAFTAIPLGYLRYQRRPWWFMTVRMSFILLTISLTLGVFYGLPLLEATFPSIFAGWYRPEHHLHYILGINLLGNLVQLGLLLPTIAQGRGGLDTKLLRPMLSYAWPILLLGLVGTLTNQADKLLLPHLFDDRLEADRLLGIYGASYKLAVIMVLFTQAFRYAYDPFVFAKSRDSDEAARRAYADAMKYYLITALVIMLAVMAYLDVIKLLIPESYYSGLVVVPYIMVGQLMFGLYSNLSIWFKLTDQTHWGAILSCIGCFLTVGVIYFLTPVIGFEACAYASVVANGAMMILSYLLGRRYYPVPYELPRMGLYAAITLGSLILLALIRRYTPDLLWVRLPLGTLILLPLLLTLLRLEVHVPAPKRAVHKLLRR